MGNPAIVTALRQLSPSLDNTAIHPRGARAVPSGEGFGMETGFSCMVIFLPSLGQLLNSPAHCSFPAKTKSGPVTVNCSLICCATEPWGRLGGGGYWTTCLPD